MVVLDALDVFKVDCIYRGNAVYLKDIKPGRLEIRFPLSTCHWVRSPGDT